ncbi:S24/S26 family peptidase [Ectobacillus funiculus]|uniref:S24/S26 family peptidase n=1 Tax=Ectobacillus funiculus TaxID=137993 RepID=UPI00397940C1
MKESNFLIADIKCLLEKKGWIDIPSSGVSMYPLIEEGDICRFIPLNSEKDLKKGEIILFASDKGQLIGHRYCYTFFENGVPYYVLKGDTNVSSDPPVTDVHLIGKLAMIKKKKFQLDFQGIVARMWTYIVFALPALPRYCKRYLYRKTKLRSQDREIQRM